MRLLTGWGHTAPTLAEVLDPADDEIIQAAVRDAGSKGMHARGVLARGLGRSYGDAAQNGGGVVIDMTTRTRILAWDPATGLLTAEAGASLDELMRQFVPQGWFVPVTPGTRYVTIGGAIAADIHGKNHHLHGSFSQHVRSLDLLTADGEIRTVTAHGEPDLFWATAGGMGLTGIVLRATIQMIPVRTSRMKVDTERANNLDHLIELLASTDDQYTYSVSWIDLLSKGAKMGRGVLTRGWHAEVDDLPKRLRAEPLAYDAKALLNAPALFPPGLLNNLTVGAFNEVWFRKAPKVRRGEAQTIPTFFHPLDGVRNWNRIYGPRGFLQYQFVLPFGAEEPLRRTVEMIANSGHASFLAVLKRFGPGNAGMLSFPSPGWTLALDLPVSYDLGPLLDHLDELVVSNGGRIYLAKDSRMRPELLAAMYPRLGEFRALREKLDPAGVFTSDLARRLSL
jgi:decaprenylphospho-beta-D-ribofuranose 2-oxidase